MVYVQHFALSLPQDDWQVFESTGLVVQKHGMLAGIG